jgi:hypothetical protein
MLKAYATVAGRPCTRLKPGRDSSPPTALGRVAGEPDCAPALPVRQIKPLDDDQ